jgi:hypothetical protein
MRTVGCGPEYLSRVDSGRTLAAFECLNLAHLLRRYRPPGLPCSESRLASPLLKILEAETKGG